MINMGIGLGAKKINIPHDKPIFISGKEKQFFISLPGRRACQHTVTSPTHIGSAWSFLWRNASAKQSNLCYKSWHIFKDKIWVVVKRYDCERKCLVAMWTWWSYNKYIYYINILHRNWCIFWGTTKVIGYWLTLGQKHKHHTQKYTCMGLHLTVWSKFFNYLFSYFEYGGIWRVTILQGTSYYLYDFFPNWHLRNVRKVTKYFSPLPQPINHFKLWLPVKKNKKKIRRKT